MCVSQDAVSSGQARPGHGGTGKGWDGRLISAVARISNQGHPASKVGPWVGAPNRRDPWRLGSAAGSP